MKTKLILNPFASRWEASKRQQEVEQALQNVGVKYDLSLTNHAGHAIDLTQEAISQGYENIIAAGGDGTISEVVNGIMLSGNSRKFSSLGVMPLGTANDLLVNLNMPTDLPSAAQIISNGKIKNLDVCQVNDRYFVNNSGLGLESYVSTLQNKMTKVSGILRYLLATLLGIAHNPQWHMNIEWDDGHYEGPVTLISIGNGALTGGVFYTVPHADPFDGKLSVTFGSLPTRLQILAALPKITRKEKGNITEHPAVQKLDCTWLRVTTSPATPAHADGEIFETKINSLEYKIFPAQLPIITV